LLSLRDGGATLRVGGKEVVISHAVALIGGASWGPGRDWPGLRLDTPEASGVSVRLTDGTQLQGDLFAGKAEGLVLVDNQLGKVDFPLDELSVLTVHAEGGARVPAASGRGSGDSVMLVNGDRLDGFVESIAPAKSGEGTSLAVTIEHEKVKTTVPLERVASVSLHGGPVTKPAMTVWLAGGSRTGAAEFSIANGDARIVRSKGALAATVKAARIEGVLLDSSAAVALGQCVVRAGGNIEAGPEQVLWTRDLTLPEPGQVSWELPKGASRISGWAVLPEECRQWGDCTVTIAVAGAAQSREQKVVEFTLNGAAPVVPIDQPLPASAAAGGAWLSVTVGEGKNGPVQDRVVLRRVLVGLGKQ
jgi:hypothetical protein